jgi:NitT/TauT family transport system substrate-binding protein
MKRSNTALIIAAVVFCFALIVFFRVRALNPPPEPNPDHTTQEDHQGPNITGQRQTLTVAFLPVTCHLTCPVTDYATKTSTTGTRFDAERFAEFPPIVEALKTRSLEAGFVTVPLAMKMREQGAPIKICCLGHRDGSQLVIRKDLDAKDLHDLRGKTIAIPSPFSNENFFMNKMMRDQGLNKDDIKFLTVAPPDMVVTLASKAVDGFIVAEPFCGKAEMDGVGKVMYYAKDIWPNYISCCLVVHEDLIREKPEVVKDLVRGINESGEWVEQHRAEAATLVSPYNNQPVKLLNYVLTHNPTLVTYRNLNPTDEELQKIMDMGISLGFLKKQTPMSELIDRSYIPAHIEPAKIDLSHVNEIKPNVAPKPATAPKTNDAPKGVTK